MYIELMDVDYNLDDASPKRKADIVVSRTCSFVRHLGEATKK